MNNNVNEIFKLNETFLSNPKFEKLSNEVYICRNFLTEEECKSLIEEARKDCDSFKTEYSSKSLILYKDRLMNLLNFKTQNNIVLDNVNKDWDRLILRVEDKNDIREFCFAPHVDIYSFFEEYHQESILEKKDGFKDIAIGYMSFIIYFSEDFEGGEIYYPEYDIKYKPKVGDMVIHNVEVIHAVYKIIGGERWSYQGSISIKKYVDENRKNKFILDNEYYQECRMKNNIDYNPDFFYRADQVPILNKRLLSYVNGEPYL